MSPLSSTLPLGLPFAFGVRPNDLFESSEVKQKKGLKIGLKIMVSVAKMYV